MDVQIPGVANPIGGNSPIVIIGPNGVGKTQLGVQISRMNDGARVAALRQIEIGEIPMQRLDHSSREVKNALDTLITQHWRQSYEFQNLMAEILVEDSQHAVKYRSEREKNPSTKVDEQLVRTRLVKIVEIWNRHFPGRKINIDYSPQVERTRIDGTVATYPIAQMSEGERTALYLAARVVSCDKKLIVVDEPESFFHPLLARNFWNDLEAQSPEVRFIYITHDIPFALSRKNAQFAIARSEQMVDLLPMDSKIPQDIVADVLGAASFSISASRLIFCEGKKNSLDVPILSAWHNCPNTAVIPVGGCNAVRECVEVFRTQEITGGREAYGYIDRDAWPESYLEADEFVKAHTVSEIEGIFCYEPIFKALAIFNGASEAEAQEKFGNFLSEARGSFRGIGFNKEVLCRAKQRVEIEQKSLLNPIKPNLDLEAVKTTFVAAAPSSGWPTYLEDVFNQENVRLTSSLAGKPSEFIRDFPAKSYVATAAKHMGFVQDKMVGTLCKALTLSDVEATKEDSLRLLRDVIVGSITPFLWPRLA